MTKICLDAGHYGDYNRSPAVPEYYESRMNWKLHLLLKAELESYGMEVITTRADAEKDLGLEARGRASAGCDLFLSLHSNAAGSGVYENIDYVVAYVMLDGSTDALGTALSETVAKIMSTTQSPRINTREGSNGEYYGVLRGAASVGTPGIILEHSFHTQTRATRWLMEDTNLQKLAAEEAKVIAEYFAKSKLDAAPERWYRIRKSWGDAGSQLGAYKDLALAKEHCPVGYTIFDNDGKPVYTQGNAMAWWQSLGLDVPAEPISGETLVDALYRYHNAVNK